MMLILATCLLSTTVQVRTNLVRDPSHGVVVAVNTVLTAAHVVDGARWVTVDHRRATVSKRHATQDLAWLSVRTEGWRSIPCRRFAPKQTVTYAGRETKGLMSLCYYCGRWRALLRLNKRAIPGDSGRPILQDGKVVGVVVASKGDWCFVEVIR